MFLSVATPALAHRLDEYLQATSFVVDGDHVEVQMRLTPGVEVFDRVLAAIDADGDGVAEPVYYNGFRAGTDVVGPSDPADAGALAANHVVGRRIAGERSPSTSDLS